MKNLYYTRVLIGCILTLLFYGSSISQVNQEWVARYNGTGNLSDAASSIAVDGSGNVYVTGTSTGSGTYEDYTTFKYNSSGVQQWVQRYNGPGNSRDATGSIIVDSSGNVYVTGTSIGIGTYTDCATIKYNSAGVQQWEARYNGPGNLFDGASSIAVDGSGNVYVTGYSYGSGTGSDYVTIKYNLSGDSVWVKIYNGTGNSTDQAFSIVVDGSDNIYVTGYSTGSGTFEDYTTIKYNSSGVQQWVQRYNSPGNSFDYASSIAIDGSGNIYVTGRSQGSGTGNDYATIKYNSSGDSVWVKRYNGTGNSEDAAISIAVDGSGNVYVAGGSTGSGTGVDYTTVKYNSSGDSVWIKRYNGAGNNTDYANSIEVDGSGNVYVTGQSTGSGTFEDYTTLKYNSSGDSVWVKNYNGTGNSTDQAFSIVVDSLGNVYVTGWSYGSGTDYDYATIKYSQSTGIMQISSEIPEQYSLSQNYPNPFNPVTNLEFGISDLGFVSLKVYDILGKEVVTLVNEKLSPGKYKAQFDGSGLTSGVYFYRLTSGEFTDTKRMILVK